MTRCSFPVAGKRETGADVLTGEIGEVPEDFILRHAGGQVFEHVVDRDPQTPDARFPPPQRGTREPQGGRRAGQPASQGLAGVFEGDLLLS